MTWWRVIGPYRVHGHQTGDIFEKHIPDGQADALTQGHHLEPVHLEIPDTEPTVEDAPIEEAAPKRTRSKKGPSL